MDFKNFLRYEAFIFIGIIMIIGTLLKLFNVVDFSSDWFWFIAGIGLVIEGTISYLKQRNFDKKFKILDKEEYEKIMMNLKVN